MNKDRRVILMVMDSLGAGELPDADKYGDKGASTINHIVDRVPDIRSKIPNLLDMGYGNIKGVSLPPSEAPSGAFGRAAEASNGKDTITGHWEIAGLVTTTPFQTFTDTGFPIVYTSADSVFQIAADTDVIPLEKLYDMCQTARDMLRGDLLVGRVIARPYTYRDGVYTRTSDRRDYSVDPPADTLLDVLKTAGLEVNCVGKIHDIFNGRGMTSSVHTVSNMDGVDKTIEYMKKTGSGLIFTNLVDFDAKYGHRRDPEGYAGAIEEFDARIPEIEAAMNDEDILILTADHGNDPTFKGWNHTREYVPLMVSGRMIKGGADIGTRNSFADISASACEFLGVENTLAGESFLDRILK
ncbi:MAG: phosphopentomutase [Anaerovoracaceae bacterium]|nr:phosphopentomutase [Bacillota bacterium]MDY2670361.1 phosphopentomutase [Anaerovoracaceae bacterium]